MKYIFQRHARGRRKRYYDWAHHPSEYVGISMLGELDFFHTYKNMIITGILESLIRIFTYI